MERIFGEPAVTEWRRVGTSEDDRTCLAEIGHHRTVFGRDEISVRCDTVGCSLALDINVELYRDWDTVQRTDGCVVLQRYVRLLCFPQGVVCHHMHDGIQMRIDLGDTI